MFQRIQELIDDSEALVCVLIDEVMVQSSVCTLLGCIYLFTSLEVPITSHLHFSPTHIHTQLASYVILIQVESLTSARKSAMSGSEPSDAIRVVNALLTQLDQVKRYPNVLILTTSNVTGAIDLAFVDRSALVSLPLTLRFCWTSEMHSHICIMFHSCNSKPRLLGIKFLCC